MNDTPAIWIQVMTEEKKVHLPAFFSGMKVLSERPHIVNRNLVGVKILETWSLNNKTSSACDVLDEIKFFEMYRNETIDEIKKRFEAHFNVFPIDSSYSEGSSVVVQFRKLIPKDYQNHVPLYEILIVDKTSVTFILNCDSDASTFAPAFPYRFSLENEVVSLSIMTKLKEEEIAKQRSINWLKSKVFPKVLRWCENPSKGPAYPSLCRISLQDYSDIYNRLKMKYGKKLIEMWPEVTDPLKFVYEDIAIAAYLMTFWKEERTLLNTTKLQSFVDLGCGNGLLVHILASEGHLGIGIDVRQRKIWDLYEPETKLIEKTFVPSDEMLFPEYDWIIGNHSDELTPWIPVIAARSSYQMRVFLLPCCCYTFTGKFSSNTSQGRYEAYIEFIKTVCKEMGFQVLQDKLRIPSTKRVCLICPSRMYDINEEEKIEKQRTEFIKSNSCIKINEAKKICSHPVFNENKNSQPDEGNSAHKKLERTKSISETVNSEWVSNFKPREKVEIIRNCSRIDKTLIENILSKIFELLIQTENYIEVETDYGPTQWNAGGKWLIKDIAEQLGQETLLNLKSQHGGLQTLLRNHKNIFTVAENSVSLTTPFISSSAHRKSKKPKRTKNSKAYLEKPCFFYCHHPQGCPLPTEKCTFLHKNINS